MNIELTKVDFRLIHNQVVIRWLTRYQINEIIMIDTILSRDTFMQEAFGIAAPKGAEITVVNVEDAIKRRQEGAFDKDRVMVLFKGMAELNATIQAGSKLEKAQINGLGEGPGHKAVNNAITLDRVGTDTLLELEEMGTEIYFQTISDYPSETLQKIAAKL